jgi:hypothetical protein
MIGGMRTLLTAAAVLAAMMTNGDALVLAQQDTAAPMPGVAELDTMTARFAPAEIGAPIGALPLNERAALAKLVEAARLMDGLFLRQVWAGNPSMLTQLASDTTPLGRARLHYFLLNKGCAKPRR